MKWPIALFLIMNFAHADTEPRIDIDENHVPPEEQVYSEKYDAEDVDAKVKQEEQESEVNDDFDPELDAIDDDMTVDEGLSDD